MTDKRRKSDPDDLAPDDLALWRQATHEAKPIRRRALVDRRATEKATVMVAPVSVASPPGRTALGARPAPKPPAAVPKPARSEPPLERGQSPGVDRRQAARLKRGRTPIEARLDLHGMTQDAAHKRLTTFIENAVASDRRAVLVVTGKGLKEGSGIIRAQVPRWLNEPRLRPLVLTYEYALPKDGGMGALYILLRKRR